MSELWVDDFIGGSSESGELGRGWSSTTVGGASAVTRLASVEAHPGLVALSTGAAATNLAALHQGTSATSVTFAVGDVLRLRKTARLSSVANVRARVGLGTDLTAASWGADGVYLEYDSSVGATWRLVCRAGGVSTTSDTGVAAAATVFFALALRRLPDETWDATVTDDVGVQTRCDAIAGAPASSTLLVWGASVETLAAAAKVFTVDAAGVRYVRPDPLAAGL